VADAKAKISDAKASAADLREKSGKELNQAIDKFDKTVEKKSSEAKSGISSWFGGKK